MDKNTLLLNQVEYEFDIQLSNGDGIINLPINLFKQLEIEEYFTHWSFEGSLVYDNSFEQLERYKRNSNSKNTEFFYFRMDGTDVITITLTPTFKTKSSKGNKGKSDFPIDIMTLKLKGSIYDSEDLSQDNILNKYKKLYFCEYYYNTAVGLNQRVSSGEYLSNRNFASKGLSPKDVGNLDNETRRVLNGDLLKYIFSSKLGAPVSSEIWNSGLKRTFYVSSPTSSVSDDINYLLEGYFDDDGYPAYLKYCRLKDEFTLESYADVFRRYSADLKERFHFSDPSKPNKGVIPIRGATSNTFHIPTFSDILSYKYSKMTGSDNMKFINSRSVSTYSNCTKTFNTYFNEGHITNIKKKYRQLLNTFTSGNKNPLIVTNEFKNKNYGLIEDYSWEPTSSAAVTLKSALILNDSIFFEVLGLPNRTPGTFIEIESDTDTEGIWEDRFLGTWLIIQVNHKISTEGYINQILAIKPNMSESFSYPNGSQGS